MLRRSRRFVPQAVPFLAAVALAFAANVHATAADSKDETIRKLEEQLRRAADRLDELKKENESLRQSLDATKKAAAKLEDQAAVEAARAKEAETNAKEAETKARRAAERALDAEQLARQEALKQRDQAEKARQAELLARKLSEAAEVEARKAAEIAAVEREKVLDKLAKFQKELELAKASELEVTKKLLATLEKLDATAKEAIVQRDRAVNAQVNSKLLLERSLLLEQRVAELEKALKLKEGKEPIAPDKKPERNPPPGDVQGVVKGVDGDLIKVSIGTDAGLAKGHTLEIFRLAPKPQYLGTLLIVEVSPREAVARVAGKAIAPIKVGDTVANKIVGD
jgi:hypothetical protein